MYVIIPQNAEMQSYAQIFDEKDNPQHYSSFLNSNENISNSTNTEEEVGQADDYN